MVLLPFYRTYGPVKISWLTSTCNTPCNVARKPKLYFGQGKLLSDSTDPNSSSIWTQNRWEAGRETLKRKTWFYHWFSLVFTFRKLLVRSWLNSIWNTVRNAPRRARIDLGPGKSPPGGSDRIRRALGLKVDSKPERRHPNHGWEPPGRQSAPYDPQPSGLLRSYTSRLWPSFEAVAWAGTRLQVLGPTRSHWKHRQTQR